MQKDFHYDVIYVLANWAGFDSDEAKTIAYASQYVDDANNSGRIQFDTGATYTRTSSAHDTLDVYHNSDDVENHNVWLPFHFLPGNSGYIRGEAEDKPLIERLVCTYDSFVARDMVKEAIRHGNKPYGLHRFGIAMHTYADTWAHRGFAGIVNEINKVKSIVWLNDAGELVPVDLAQQVKNRFVDAILPVGHGPAICNPDLPFLKEWQFSFIEDLQRGTQTYTNTQYFLLAAENIIKAMRLFRDFQKSSVPLVEDLSAIYDGYLGMTTEQRDTLERIFVSIQNEDGDKRHEEWMKKATTGEIPGVSSIPEYKAKGEGSWKCEALGTTLEFDLPEEHFIYTPEFINSNWKKFHDGLQVQRQYILLELLPSYGICVS